MGVFLKKHRMAFILPGCCAALTLLYMAAFSGVSAEGVRDALLRYGDLAPVIYMLLFAVLPTFFFPVAVLAFAGGLMFGLLWGSVYTFIGAVINCALMFFLARRLGREKIRALVQRKLPSVWQARLKKAGVEAAQLEAREILCAASGKTAEELYRDISLYTTEAIAEQALALQERRLAGEPIAYLVGEWSFCGLPFYVSPAALIPRVDTEMLAQLAMNRLKEHQGSTRVLDLCAGTGCVGLTVAALMKNTRAVLVDLSDGALDLCKRNIRRHKLTGRAVYLKGDALQPPSHALGQFDVLVCNPPYIPTGDLAGLDSSVKDFEPMMALDGGADGLDFYRGITSLWQPALKPGGHLLYEVGIGQAEQVAWLLVKAGYENIRITRDTGGIDRVVEGQRPKEQEIPDLLHETLEEEG